YSLSEQVELARGVRRLGAGLPGGLGKLRRPAPAIAVALALGAATAVVLARRRRRAGPTPLGARAQDRAQKPTLALYQKVLRLCARAGAPRGPSQTPLEFARALLARDFPGADVVRAVTEVYYRARFGHLLPGPRELAALEQELDRIGQRP